MLVRRVSIRGCNFDKQDKKNALIQTRNPEEPHSL